MSANNDEFIESKDTPDEAWEAARQYAGLLKHDDRFAGWLVSVQKIWTNTGFAYGIFISKPEEASEK